MPYQPIDFVTIAPVTGTLDVTWLSGSPGRRRSPERAIQVHRYDAHTVVLRQSKTVSFEAPFLYLLFGNDRALLLDTGATKDPIRFPLRRTVDDLMEDWLSEYPRDDYGLVVAHTHGHSDHVAADTQFGGRANTVVVSRDLRAVTSFFGFSRWPQAVVQLDLGGRVLDVTGCPGHHESSIAVFDPWTGFLLTGDTVYPGRLYVSDFPAFAASLDRLVQFAETRPVKHVLGCHVEMSRTPGRDYPMGCTYQPDEADLPMTVEQLAQVREAALAVADRPGAHVFDDFIIYNGPCRRAVAKQLARNAWGRLRGR